ncbi:MAG: UPF0280 family protein [Candidatus Altiarchaeota archaeon]|nr:UPF0280 family protein [Candidatus Altiarchaeota archaeon]
MISRNVEYKESRLNILCDLNFGGGVFAHLVRTYTELDAYIKRDSYFGISYSPVKLKRNPPQIAVTMADAAGKAGVGPMAAVAGAIAEDVGRILLEMGAREVIVENGGDIFLSIRRQRTIGIHAGCSGWSNNLALKVRPKETPCGICTSSATVGPSVSLGDADAITVVADTAALADAAATAVGNMVKGDKGVERALDYGRGIPGVRGLLIIRGGTLAAGGSLPEIVERRFHVKR